MERILKSGKSFDLSFRNEFGDNKEENPAKSIVPKFLCREPTKCVVGESGLEL